MTSSWRSNDMHMQRLPPRRNAGQAFSARNPLPVHGSAVPWACGTFKLFGANSCGQVDALAVDGTVTSTMPLACQSLSQCLRFSWSSFWAGLWLKCLALLCPGILSAAWLSGGHNMAHNVGHKPGLRA